MAISGSVQFIGIDPVINSYQARKVPAWGMFQNRQFLFKYEGTDLEEGAELLSKILEQVADGPAVYTLKVYENPPAGKIREKTECDGSFNFRISETTATAQASAIGGAANYEIMRALDGIKRDQDELKKRFDMEEAEENTDAEIGAVNSPIGIVKEILLLPGVGEMISGIAARFFSPIPVNTAGVAGIAGAPSDISENEELQRVLIAYQAIKEGMPDALQLLEKLAYMQANDPKKFAAVKGSISLFV